MPKATARAWTRVVAIAGGLSVITLAVVNTKTIIEIVSSAVSAAFQTGPLPPSPQEFQTELLTERDNSKKVTKALEFLGHYPVNLSEHAAKIETADSAQLQFEGDLFIIHFVKAVDLKDYSEINLFSVIAHASGEIAPVIVDNNANYFHITNYLNNKKYVVTFYRDSYDSDGVEIGQYKGIILADSKRIYPEYVYLRTRIIRDDTVDDPEHELRCEGYVTDDTIDFRTDAPAISIKTVVQATIAGNAFHAELAPRNAVFDGQKYKGMNEIEFGELLLMPKDCSKVVKFEQFQPGRWLPPDDAAANYLID